MVLEVLVVLAASAVASAAVLAAPVVKEVHAVEWEARRFSKIEPFRSVSPGHRTPCLQTEPARNHIHHFERSSVAGHRLEDQEELKEEKVWEMDQVAAQAWASVQDQV